MSFGPANRPEEVDGFLSTLAAEAAALRELSPKAAKLAGVER